MDRFRWSLLVATVCLPVGWLAAGMWVPFLDPPAGALPRPLAVPDGDQEMAWLHTSINWTTWERFVSGFERAQMAVPGLRVDDSGAFRDASYEVPELVLSMAGRAGKVRIRWYKLTSDATTAQWVQALAARDHPPLAVIGGGTTDRAAELAEAMAAQQTWPGDKPLLFLTTATAVSVGSDTDPGAPGAANVGLPLTQVYAGRTFRFCFSNQQMADAVLSFVWERPDLRPQLYRDVAPLAAGSGLVAGAAGVSPRIGRPQVFTVLWEDDPFSIDLGRQFGDELLKKLNPDGPPSVTPVRLEKIAIPFGVGGFSRPNTGEARVAETILDQYRDLPVQRSLLVLPTVTQPARRLLRTLALAAPELADRLVAVTGDGIPVNAVFRDGEFAWPIHTLPVPTVLFTHNDPVAWDDPGGPSANAPPGYELYPPSSTEDVLHFAEMGRIVTEAAFGIGCPDGPPSSPTGRVLGRADELVTYLRDRCPPFFDRDGNRLGGSGEYVVVVRPKHTPNGYLPVDPIARLDVWKRSDDRRWEPVRTLAVDQWRVRVPLAGQGGGRQ